MQLPQEADKFFKRFQERVGENARHEILNDISYDVVVRDIVEFCKWVFR